MNYKQNILDLKKKLGAKITIPGHHYQIPEIVELTDFVGDSYKLAVDCSKTDSEFIVFCGVKFMAEGASLLANKQQKVILPVLSAGCPLADYIDAETSEQAMQRIQAEISSNIYPVFYMNSYVDAKSVCGKFEGAVCTSSNAAKIVKYFLDKGQSVFFAPDYNLGINTADQLGLEEREIVKVNRDLTFDKVVTSKAKFFIWDGNCRVHKRFQKQDLEKMRQKYPEAKIVVHPECDREIVKAADMAGSTQMIYNEIRNAPTNSTWIVGTEYHFVIRLDSEFPDKKVIPLRKSICQNMAKIGLKDLSASLSNIDRFLAGKANLENEIKIDSKQSKNAQLALKKMIEITEG